MLRYATRPDDRCATFALQLPHHPALSSSVEPAHTIHISYLLTDTPLISKPHIITFKRDTMPESPPPSEASFIMVSGAESSQFISSEKLGVGSETRLDTSERFQISQAGFVSAFAALMILNYLTSPKTAKIPFLCRQGLFSWVIVFVCARLVIDRGRRKAQSAWSTLCRRVWTRL